MTYDYFKGNLIIELPERINETNSQQIKDEILEIMAKNPDCRPDLDLKNLKYISSSGLRSFLTIQKKWGKGQISLKNVSKDVNGILEMTGFDSIFHVSKLLHQCNIDGCVPIAKCINGSLYALKGGMMVKAFNPEITLEEVEIEMGMSQKAMTCGVPTPISFSTVKCNNGFGILFEEITGDSIASLLREHPESAHTYAKQIALQIKELHEIKILPDRLPSVKSRYQEMLAFAKYKLNNDDWLQLNALIETIEDRETFVHGDLSLDKIFLLNDEIILMDMANCGYGHPTFDLQSLYASLVAIEIDNPGYCKEKFDLDPSICREFWKLFARYYLDIDGISEASSKTLSKMNQLLSRYCMLKEALLDTLHG